MHRRSVHSPSSLASVTAALVCIPLIGCTDVTAQPQTDWESASITDPADGLQDGGDLPPSPDAGDGAQGGETSVDGGATPDGGGVDHGDTKDGSSGSVSDSATTLPDPEDGSSDALEETAQDVDPSLDGPPIPDGSGDAEVGLDTQEGPDLEPDAALDAAPDSQPEPDAEPDSALDPDTSSQPDTPAEPDVAVEPGPAWSDGPIAYANHSESSDERAIELIEQAWDSLGFALGSVVGPQPEDRWFVGSYYVGWIDRTGFVGKLNGLWRLNGEPGDALDFVVFDGDRPVNFLIVGENGEGDWPAGYPGSEHAEFPSTTPEPNDNASCAEGDWCNQYAHEEASELTDPDIPWWSSCNAGSVDWLTVFDAIETTVTESGVRVIYEAPLVKEADGDGDWDNDACHEDWLFPDGVRRPVYLRAGYELRGDQPFLDRLMQFRNPQGNPPFDGPMSLIGGFVITTWPQPHPLKSLGNWIRPEQADLYDSKHGFQLFKSTWNDHQVEPASADEVYGWVGQPIALSQYPEEVAGQTARLDHVGPSDNDDVGFCLCAVHGGLEMGGGVLHGGISLPIGGDSLSIEARRRLTLPGATLTAQSYVYEAEGPALSHATGKAEPDGWSANTTDHPAGHMIFGPYATDWVGATGTAHFQMMIDNHDANSEEVLTLDIYDASAGVIVASLGVNRDDFASPFTYQTFSLPFSLVGHVGHAMETRVYWQAKAFIQVDKVTVEITP